MWWLVIGLPLFWVVWKRPLFSPGFSSPASVLKCGISIAPCSHPQEKTCSNQPNCSNRGNSYLLSIGDIRLLSSPRFLSLVDTDELTSVAHRPTLVLGMARPWWPELGCRIKTWSLCSSIPLEYTVLDAWSLRDAEVKVDTWSTRKENALWKGTVFLTFICRWFAIRPLFSGETPQRPNIYSGCFSMCKLNLWRRKITFDLIYSVSKLLKAVSDCFKGFLLWYFN